MQICENKKKTSTSYDMSDPRSGLSDGSKVNNPGEKQEWNHNPLKLQDPKICENLAQNSKSILKYQLA